MFHDVRMRGFKERADVAEVQAWIDALPTDPDREHASIEIACGRVLAEDVVSPVDVPSFSRSAMDGWAVCNEDTLGASDTDPILLRVVGTSLPGRPHDGAMGAGRAVRIMTGAPLPEGADAVLRAEDGEQREDELQVRATVPRGRHVGEPGEDVKEGQTVLHAGRRLRPQDIGLAGSIGCSSLPVLQPPLVEVLVTGDEVQPWGAPPVGANIADANGPMLNALIARDGGGAEIVYMQDDATALHAHIKRNRVEADVLIVTGGSSVGEEDHAPRILHELGELVFHGVAMRPAAPTGMGTIGERAVFLLPGNPVSCLSAYDFFAGRLVRRMAGRSPEWPYAPQRGTLTRKIASVLGRVDYVRVAVDGAAITPIMTRGASILSSTTEADGFVVVERDSEGHPEGSEVTAFLYDL